ncbi:hypothetical protein [Andreprevotia lacus]|nr:hypothetical protein [Andreprevotia lacus]
MKRMKDDELVSTIAGHIRQYLAARPQSADTLEGIHQWWINWPTAPESPSVTLAALQQLEQAGVVMRVHVGGRDLWRAAR